MISKKLVIACGMCLVTLCACGNNDAVEETASTPQAPVMVETLPDEEHPDHVIGDGGDKVTLAPEPGEHDQASLDSWFFNQMSSAGIPDTESALLKIRSQVCANLKNGGDIESLNEILAPKQYSPEQIGVIIASSMISSCKDTSVIVDKQDMP